MKRDRGARGRENGLPHDAHDVLMREKIEGDRERVETQRGVLEGGSSEIDSRRTTVRRSQTPHRHRSPGWPRQLLLLV